MSPHGAAAAPPPAERPVPLVYVFLDFGDGGAQRVTLTELRLLDRRRFAPSLLALRGEGALLDRARALDVPVRTLGRLTRPRDATALSAVADALRSSRAQVVIGQHYSRSLPYLLAAARLAHAPLRIVRHHGHAPPAGAGRRLADRLLQRGAAHLAVSEADTRALLESGLPRDAVALVRHGVDLSCYAPGDSHAARIALGLPADRPIVLLPARLSPIKGHMDLLAALPLLLAHVPDVLVLCCGEGPLRATLPAVASSAGLAGAVRFVGRRDDLPLWLAACDLVCLPSHDEGLPLALLEAHAAGRAVVASAVGGVPEVVAEGRTGLLVPPRNPGALATALATVLGDSTMRRAMGQAARARAAARFDERVAVRGLEDRLAAWLAARGVAVPAVPVAPVGRIVPAGRTGAAMRSPGRATAPPLRVLHVRSTHGRHGPERSLLELLPALAGEGVAVHLLALHRPSRLEPPRSPSAAPQATQHTRPHGTPKPPDVLPREVASLHAPPDALRWLDEARAAGAGVTAALDPSPASPVGMRAIKSAARSVDLIHSHDYRADLLTWAARWHPSVAAPWLATVHLHTRDSARLRLWRRLDLRALRSAAAVTTVSLDQAGQLRNAGLSAGRIHHLPNAIDADRFAAAVGDSQALARRLRGRAAGPLLVFVGRLTEQKGVDLLLDCLPVLRAQWPGLVLAVAGDGPRASQLESQAHALGLDGAVRWLGPVEEVATLLAAADLVVLPSRREGHPMVLLEAMAVAAPIVAARVTGIEGAVSDGHAARLVPPEDAAALGRAIAHLLADPAAARALGAAAAAEVRARYAPAAVAARLAALYRAVLADEEVAP
jgi:glycosyltransferase involved in cell wall biosynthesis